MLLVFRESDAPQIALIARAEVRRALEVSPENVVFPQMGKGESADGALIVQNFGDSAWEDIAVACDAQWVSTTRFPIVQRSHRKLPRQAWRVTVRVNAAELAHGRHAANVVICSKASGRQDLVCRVPVDLRVVPPAELVPDQLFFGTMSAGRAVSRRGLLRFSPKSVPPDAGTVSVRHDLGDSLYFRWARTAGLFWEFEATLTPRVESGAIHGSLTIDFPGPAIPKVQVPIRGWVAAK